jgi:hypothetical protein
LTGEASTDEFKLLPPAAEVELDQNKTSSQKICSGLENIRVGQMFAKDISSIPTYTLYQSWATDF